MYYIGSSHAGLGVVNAIGSNGLGACIALDLWTSVRLKECNRLEGSIRVRGRNIEVDKEILSAIVDVVKEYTGISIKGICVEGETIIPFRAGLKGSSSLVNAIIEAILKAHGKNIDIETLALLGVEASKKANITITGALDDHLAVSGCGGYVTNNQQKKIVAHTPTLEGYVAISIQKEVDIRSINPGRFTEHSTLYRIAWELARNNHWWEAAIINGIASSLALNLEIEHLAEVFSINGVVAIGVSGKSPTIYIIATNKKALKKATMCLKNEIGGQIIVTKLLSCSGEAT